MPKLSRAKRIVLTLLLAGAAASTHAASDAAFQSAFDHFTKATAGDEAAIEKAASSFATLLSAEPANPVLMAYSGASTAMLAKTTFLPFRKLGYAEDGLAKVDKALAVLTPASDAPIQHSTPGSLEVKFVSATTMLAVPDFMNRNARAVKLLTEIVDSPLFGKAPLAFRGQVLLRAGEVAVQQNRVADARRLFGEVITQGAPQAGIARTRLRDIPA